ncbi:pancreatic lipase-related protein 2-like [Oppia nitens]|uniref:pancreatic lipase-related protein 2-like n=1 Tax=Oppia nitens TaxID=1686743 RepID=UPI0023DAFF6B|nr:pancreatic lipase-related protein 2-like [Oppia nitens]
MKIILVLVLVQYYITNVYTATVNKVVSADENGIFEVTYPGIGHFTLKDFYDPIWRPLVLLPQSPEHINTKFLLHTRQNLKTAQVLKQGDLDAIKNSYFDGNKPTKFIIHGFLDNQLFGEWMRKMKDTFLESNDYNVFIVDWSGGNGLPYTQATANTKVVGPVIGLFINDLKTTKNLKVSDVHILGHSLGSHVAGYAGEKLNGTVGRITGLDPAGPYYEGLTFPAAKLDPTDAVFVDAIHTDARHLIPDLGFGMYETSGHLDFYPNGGHDQTGCDTQRWLSIITDGLMEGVRRMVACNHQRAVDFYLASIDRKNIKGVSYQCKDFDTFNNGLCVDCGPNNDKCAVLGDEAIQSQKYEKSIVGTRFFLTTDGKSPYFKYEYEVQIKMADDGVDNHGVVTLTLHGNNAQTQIQLNDKDQIFHLGQTYTFIVRSDANIGDITKMTFKWHRTLGSIIHQKMWIDSITVDPISSDNIMDKQKHMKEIRTFCAPVKGEGIQNEKEIDLLDSC